jgi:hypothetical protein
MVEVDPYLLKTVNQTEPSTIIVTGDVAVMTMMVEMVLQWWFHVRDDRRAAPKMVIVQKRCVAIYFCVL